MSNFDNKDSTGGENCSGGRDFKRITEPAVLEELRARARGRVKLAALDLDGTTLCGWELTGRTAKALQKAIDSGIFVLIATGRAYGSLPEDVLALRGLKYVVTSNGAGICNAETGQVLYSFCIDGAKMEAIHDAIVQSGYNIELFSRGVPYIEKSYFDEVMEGKHPYVSMEYIRRTRKPIENLMDYMLENRDWIENINIHLPGPEDRARMHGLLKGIDGVTLTSSHRSNIEIGGVNTNKGNGVEKVCRMLGLEMGQVMAFGDSPNDISMLKRAAFGMAMGGGEPSVLAAADYVCPGSDEEGVAYAFERILL